MRPGDWYEVQLGAQSRPFVFQVESVDKNLIHVVPGSYVGEDNRPTTTFNSSAVEALRRIKEPYIPADGDIVGPKETKDGSGEPDFYVRLEGLWYELRQQYGPIDDDEIEMYLNGEYYRHYTMPEYHADLMSRV